LIKEEVNAGINFSFIEMKLSDPPMQRSASGIVISERSVTLCLIITGKSILKNEKGTASRTAMTSGLRIISFNIPGIEVPLIRTGTVRARTEMMVYSGIKNEISIAERVSPEDPNRLFASASPIIATLLLYDPCMNAPFVLPSLIVIPAMIHDIIKNKKVTEHAIIISEELKIFLKSAAEIFMKMSDGRETLKTIKLDLMIKLSSIKFFFLNRIPRKTRMKTGRDVFILITKFSISAADFRHGPFGADGIASA
jgi:hypothetical protein